MEEIKINGVDAFVAFLQCYKEEMQFKAMFSTMDSVWLLFAQFRRNLEEKGYTDEEINQFIEKIVLPVLQNKVA